MKSLALALLLGACGTEFGPSTSPVELPTDGPGIYKAVCARCHGSTGGGSAGGPEIRNPVHDYATYVTRTGRGNEMDVSYADPMPAHGTDVLDDAQLKLVLDFLSSASKPVAGNELYARFCQNCHGVGSSGGRADKDIRDELDELEETVREGHHLGEFAEADEYMPRWSEAAITRVELDAIAAYLRTLPPGPGDEDEDEDDD